jgi:hypothetical protein
MNTAVEVFSRVLPEFPAVAVYVCFDQMSCCISRQLVVIYVGSFGCNSVGYVYYLYSRVWRILPVAED